MSDQKYDNTNQCGLWEKTSKNGLVYISGMVEVTEPGKHWVNIFVNKNENPASPGYDMKLDKVVPR